MRVQLPYTKGWVAHRKYNDFFTFSFFSFENAELASLGHRWCVRACVRVRACARVRVRACGYVSVACLPLRAGGVYLASYDKQQQGITF